MRHKRYRPTHRASLRLLLSLALGTLLSGCGSLADLQRGSTPQPPTADAQAASQLARQLETLQRLVQGSPAEQAEIVSSARLAHEQSHTAPATLRYALTLAGPGHPARDPAAAQRLLRTVLATPERLHPLERSLALLELQRVDAELRLAEENTRLAGEAQQLRSREPSAAVSRVAAKRLQAEIEENAKLRRALEEVRAKLDAIANIERNITERKTPTEGRRP